MADGKIRMRVWVVVDNRHAPGVLIDRNAYSDRLEAEMRASSFRAAYNVEEFPRAIETKELEIL